MDEAANIAALRVLYPGAQRWEVYSHTLVFLPGLVVQTTAGPKTVDALLSPYLIQEFGGYPTRLFVNQRLPDSEKAKNWQSYQVLGEQWWAVSWQGVSPDQPWQQILAAHLHAFT